MDTNDRNDSTNRERDAKLARRLGEALDQMNPHGTATACPNAEVIAAYAERALGADEVAQCENHFASCGRCRNILKVLAAATDVPLAETEVAQLGQRVATVRTPVEITSGATKRPRSKAAAWSTRWLAPAFGVAAVLTVWFVMRPPWRAMDRRGSPTLIAQAPSEEMPESAPPAVDRVQNVARAPAPEAPAAKVAAPNSNAEPSARDQLKSKDAIHENSANDGLAKSFSEEKNEAAPLASENKPKALAGPARSPVSPPPVPPVEAPRGGVASAMSSAAPARAQASQSAEVNERAPQLETTNGTLTAPIQQQPAADLPLNGRNFQALKQLRSAQGMPLFLKAPSGVTLWRAGIAGVIERSADRGKTWSPQISPSRDDWLAGAAISDTVCWLAGRNGSIARTTDGENWTRIAPPPQTATKDGKLPDWARISAQDAQSVVITATDGVKFGTSDGGRTWQRQ
jgi:hypothetical protein